MKHWRHIKRKIFGICILLLLSVEGFSQARDSSGVQNSPPDFWDKVYFGGNFGAEFGDPTAVELSPLIGYKFTSKFSAGFGISYIYFKSDYYEYKTSIYGGRVFIKYYFINNVFGYCEEEILNMDQPDIFGNLHRVDAESTLLGGGFSQPMGGRAYLNFMVLWNLNETVYSPYHNPIIRIGFTF